eukprot:CAMPEP_0184652090 /NCGR_PEP_ID=MMETSP0308-20130426/9757_1 /TAXON_ID=38269 /ORGANISM="Gloeochaete witrockiana, Strain SAG 46.84" /LENGTH=552 /DNA_ID=CAMNT_0027086739 /DNA_START=60 /DNA_END=1715 /DNA_ORIENTATION=+
MECLRKNHIRAAVLANIEALDSQKAFQSKPISVHLVSFEFSKKRFVANDGSHSIFVVISDSAEQEFLTKHPNLNLPKLRNCMVKLEKYRLITSGVIEDPTCIGFDVEKFVIISLEQTFAPQDETHNPIHEDQDVRAKLYPVITKQAVHERLDPANVLDEYLTGKINEADCIVPQDQMQVIEAIGGCWKAAEVTMSMGFSQFSQMQEESSQSHMENTVPERSAQPGQTRETGYCSSFDSGSEEGHISPGSQGQRDNPTSAATRFEPSLEIEELPFVESILEVPEVVPPSTTLPNNVDTEKVHPGMQDVSLVNEGSGGTNRLRQQYRTSLSDNRRRKRQKRIIEDESADTDSADEGRGVTVQSHDVVHSPSYLERTSRGITQEIDIMDMSPVITSPPPLDTDARSPSLADIHFDHTTSANDVISDRRMRNEVDMASDDRSKNDAKAMPSELDERAGSVFQDEEEVSPHRAVSDHGAAKNDLFLVNEERNGNGMFEEEEENVVIEKRLGSQREMFSLGENLPPSMLTLKSPARNSSVFSPRYKFQRIKPNFNKIW